MEEYRMDLVVFLFCIYYLSTMVMVVDEVLLMMTMAAGVEQGQCLRQCLLYLRPFLPSDLLRRWWMRLEGSMYGRRRGRRGSEEVDEKAHFPKMIDMMGGLPLDRSSYYCLFIDGCSFDACTPCK